MNLETDLAEYLLKLQCGSWSQRYNRECLAMWREKYGQKVAEKVESIVREKWAK